MSDHTNTRLVHPSTGLGPNDSNIVALFAPSFEVNPEDKNDLHELAMPRDRPRISRDRRQTATTLTVQGEFMHGESLPSEHRSTLEEMFGTPNATAREQVNRIRHYMHEIGGPFEFYDEGDGYADEYRVQDVSNLDRKNGVFPAVNLDLVRATRSAGLDREEYTVKLSVGVERP